MGYLLDDVARALASPTSRRKAFRLLGGALAGGFLGTLGVKPAYAVSTGVPCGFMGFSTCNPGQQCCNVTLIGIGISGFCTDATSTCCGFRACSAGNSCCGTGLVQSCTTNGSICCGGGSCLAGSVCCSQSSGICAATSGQCPSSTPPGMA